MTDAPSTGEQVTDVFKSFFETVLGVESGVGVVLICSMTFLVAAVAALIYRYFIIKMRTEAEAKKLEAEQEGETVPTSLLERVIEELNTNILTSGRQQETTTEAMRGLGKELENITRILSEFGARIEQFTESVAETMAMQRDIADALREVRKHLSGSGHTVAAE